MVQTALHVSLILDDLYCTAIVMVRCHCASQHIWDGILTRQEISITTVDVIYRQHEEERIAYTALA